MRQSVCFPKQRRLHSSPGLSGAEVPAAQWELGMRQPQSPSLPKLARSHKHCLSPEQMAPLTSTLQADTKGLS